MPYPVFQTFTTSVTTTINKPASTVSGDVLVLFMMSISATLLTQPAGFTTPWRSSGATTVWNGGASVKVAGGAEPASYTFTAAGSVAVGSVLVRVSGASSLSASWALGGVNQNNPATTYPFITGIASRVAGEPAGMYPGQLGVAATFAYRAAAGCTVSRNATGIVTPITQLFFNANKSCLYVTQHSFNNEGSVLATMSATADTTGMIDVSVPAASPDRGAAMFMGI